MMTRVKYAALIAVVQFCVAFPELAFELRSPDQRIRFVFQVEQAGCFYEVFSGDQPVILRSPVNMVVDGVNLGKGTRIVDTEAYEVDETYPWLGHHALAVNRAKGARLKLLHSSSNTAYTFEVRAYNDGVAFRYVVPGEGMRVPDEEVAFRLPPGSTVWFHDFHGHYEGTHNRYGLRAVLPGMWAAPPLTVQLPGRSGYASISEGGLRGYSGMGLQADGNGGFYLRLGHAVPASYPFRLRYADDVERLSRPASVHGPIRTPWRVIIVARDLNELVNSDLVHNVADPPDPKLFPEGPRTEWIRPGRAVWAYLDGGDPTPEGQKEFARLAAQLGFEYNVLEGYWARWSEEQLRDVVEYSRKLGVRIILWKHSRELRDPQQREAFFDMCQRVGVAGAKVDFFDHEHREVIDRYEAILEAAARRKLIIDFHGANKPTGLERTYPNLLGIEAIRGMESRPPWAQHNVTLPFTRLIVGMADYTPTIFSRRRGETTWAHQIANAVILQAPLLVYAAHPAHLLANPAVDVIKSIPSVWDETRVLPFSEIGEVAGFARRKGQTWFVAITNGVYPRTVRVELDFLGEARVSWLATVVREGTTPDSLKIESLTVRSSDVLDVCMPSGGGFIARIARSVSGR